MNEGIKNVCKSLNAEEFPKLKQVIDDLFMLTLEVEGAFDENVITSFNKFCEYQKANILVARVYIETINDTIGNIKQLFPEAPEEILRGYVPLLNAQEYYAVLKQNTMPQDIHPEYDKLLSGLKLALKPYLHPQDRV